MFYQTEDYFQTVFLHILLSHLIDLLQFREHNIHVYPLLLCGWGGFHWHLSNGSVGSMADGTGIYPVFPLGKNILFTFVPVSLHCIGPEDFWTTCPACRTSAGDESDKV